jgi:hypothetical protein
MKSIWFVAGIVLLGAVGCGGGATGPVGTTYTLASAATLDIPPPSCQLGWGPEPVGSGTMYYKVDDLPPGTDQIETIIIADSLFLNYGCSFDPTTQVVSDDNFMGSYQNSGQVLADSYDFVVICRNPSGDCRFNLTWTATY